MRPIDIIIFGAFLMLITQCEAEAGESCPKTVIENRTEEWTDYDQATFNKATKRCGEIYNDAPCLKKFIKKDALTYNAICGR